MGRWKLRESAARKALTLALALAFLCPIAFADDVPVEGEFPETVVAVMPLAGDKDSAYWREKFTFSFERKLERQPGIVVIDRLSMETVVRSAGIDPATVDDDTVARLMADPLEANLCVRGWVKYHEQTKGVTFKVRILEALKGNSDKNPSYVVWFDKVFELEHFRDTPPVIRQLALDLAGLEEPLERVIDKITGPTIIPNGDFEKMDPKTGTVVNWGPMDGLSTFWVDEPGRGKVMRVETDVLWDQWEDWRAKIRAGASRHDAPKKKPYTGPGYNTVAGSRGVAVYNEYVPIKKGQAYQLSFDFKGAGGKVFVKGFAAVDENARELPNATLEQALTDGNGIHLREIWRAYKAMRPKDKSEWETFSRVMHPTEKIPQTRWIRINLFPYWPPGTYFFDNVSFVPVSEKYVKPERVFEGKKRDVYKDGEDAPTAGGAGPRFTGIRIRKSKRQLSSSVRIPARWAMSPHVSSRQSPSVIVKRFIAPLKSVNRRGSVSAICSAR